MLQIPECTTVYVVLDGIEWYERERKEWTKDLTIIADSFENLTTQMDDKKLSLFKAMFDLKQGLHLCWCSDFLLA